MLAPSSPPPREIFAMSGDIFLLSHSAESFWHPVVETRDTVKPPIMRRRRSYKQEYLAHNVNCTKDEKIWSIIFKEEVIGFDNWLGLEARNRDQVVYNMLEKILVTKTKIFFKKLGRGRKKSVMSAFFFPLSILFFGNSSNCNGIWMGKITRSTHLQVVLS